MLAAHPPRRTSRSSTRNDSAILSSWSTTSESANRPGNVIRWSVAMEPVMSSDTGGSSRGVGARTEERSGHGTLPVRCCGYAAVTPTVECHDLPTRLAYDDAATTTEMTSDCRRGRPRALRLPARRSRPSEAARAAVRPGAEHRCSRTTRARSPSRPSGSRRRPPGSPPRCHALRWTAPLARSASWRRHDRPAIGRWLARRARGRGRAGAARGVLAVTPPCGGGDAGPGPAHRTASSPAEVARVSPARRARRFRAGRRSRRARRDVDVAGYRARGSTPADLLRIDRVGWTARRRSRRRSGTEQVGDRSSSSSAATVTASPPTTAASAHDADQLRRPSRCPRPRRRPRCVAGRPRVRGRWCRSSRRPLEPVVTPPTTAEPRDRAPLRRDEPRCRDGTGSAPRRAGCSVERVAAGAGAGRRWGCRS